VKVFVTYTCAAIVFATISLATGCGSSNPAANTQDSRLLTKVEEVKFDPNKLNPESKRLYDEGIKSGRYGRVNAP
jgi:hypothetical protein